MVFKIPENSNPKPVEATPLARPASTDPREPAPVNSPSIPGTKNASGEYVPTADERAAIDEAWEAYVKKAQPHADAIDKLFDDHISTTKLGEVALDKIYDLRNKQKDKIASLFNKKSAEVEQLAKSKHLSLAQLQVEIQSAYDRAKLEADVLLQNNKNLLAMMGLIQDSDKFTPEQIIQLEKLVGGLAKLAQEHDKTSDVIIAKLSPNENTVDRNLTQADYAYIISKISPLELQRIGKMEVTAEEIFNTSSVGIFLHFMSPKQHLELVQQMKQIPGRANELPYLVNAMLLGGFLQPRQAENLFMTGVLSREQYDNFLRKNIENGEYTKIAEAIHEKLSKEAKELQSSQFIHSTAEELFSSQGFGGLVAFHGAGLLLINSLMAGFGFREMANNPFIGIALGKIGYGIETATASKKGIPGIFGDSKAASFFGVEKLGSGAFGQAFRKLNDYLSPDGEVMDDTKRNAYKLFGKIYMQDTEFGNFMNYDGLDAVAKLHQEKVKANEKNPNLPLTFTYEELFACATPPQQYFLNRAVTQSTKGKVEAVANTMSDISAILRIENKTQLTYYTCEVEKDYGINQKPQSQPQPANS